MLDFLGDFGIGNAKEHTEAIQSATERVNDLSELKKENGC